MIIRNACRPISVMSQKTLLGLLPSQIDTDHVIVAATGEIIDVTGQTQKTIQANLRSKVWLAIEESSPRKLLLYNEDNWQIDSFDPKSKLVCITYVTPFGERNFTFSLLS